VNDGVFNVTIGQDATFKEIPFGRPLNLGITVGKDPEMRPRVSLASSAYARALPGLYTVFNQDINGFSGFNVVGGSPHNIVGNQAIICTIGGGGTEDAPNEVRGSASTVGGGRGNLANHGGTVSGGTYNRANGLLSTVAGGTDNIAGASYAAVGGGSNNDATGLGSTIPGGNSNEASEYFSYAAGSNAHAHHEGTFVWSDYSSVDAFTSTGANQFLIRATGGVGIGTAQPEGLLHISAGTEGNAVVRIEADTGDLSSSRHPAIELLQGGGTVGARIGMDHNVDGFPFFAIEGGAETGWYDTWLGIDPATGFVGLGTLTPWGPLHIPDADFLVTSDGDVGIGTTNPGDIRLHVINEGSGGTSTAALKAENNSTGSGIAGFFETHGIDAAVVITNNGSGEIIKGFSSGGDLEFKVTNNGNVTADGSVTGGGADLAETFEVEGCAVDYEPGDVLEISLDADRLVTKSTLPYSSRVAGVYATKPGMQLGGEPIDGQTIPMGVVGVIPTKVSNENGPIRRGDLLVTSSTPGHAMKAEPVVVNGIEVYPTGTILGKALQPFEGPGTGLIDVLVNTQ
jgi:hypothetical protein